MLSDTLMQRVEFAIKKINKDNGESLSMGCPIPIRYDRRFIPDYVIDWKSKPFLIIEEKEKITPFAKSVFAKGVSEWGAYGILNYEDTFIVYGRLSCNEVGEFDDLIPAIRKVLEIAGQEISSKDGGGNASNEICDLIRTAANAHLYGEIRNRVINLVDGWVNSSASLFEIENGSYVLTDRA